MSAFSDLSTQTTSVAQVRTAPLSPEQLRFWSIYQLLSVGAAYNIAYRYQLTGTINPEILEKSLREIMLRHEILRTTFQVQDDGTPVQVIAPTVDFTLPYHDLRNLPPAEIEAETHRLAHREAHLPFDLSQGPLIRLRLVRTSEDEHVLIVVMDHIISDGWSLGVMGRELGVLYAAFLQNEPHSLPALAKQFADYAIEQPQRMQSPRVQRQLEYWKRQLKDQKVCEMPTDRPRPALQTFRGDMQNVDMPAPLLVQLKALSQREGVTLFMLLLAAFQTLMYRYTGQADVSTATLTAGRLHDDNLQDLIGPFLNTLILRSDLSGDPSFRELLQRVKKVALGAFLNQDLSFEKIVEAIKPQRTLSHNPHFRILFGLQSATLKSFQLPGCTITPDEIPTGYSKLDYYLVLVETPDGLKGSIEYNADLFEAATIQRMLRNYQTLLEAIVENPEEQLSRLHLLTAQERHLLLAEWNDTSQQLPAVECLQELVEAQVLKTPDQVAVVFEGQAMTYQELNCRANQLAHHLQRLGVGPEVIVGICVERSPELVVGLLGILKAGGAYLPLDPSLPPGRLAFMLEETHAQVLLTQHRLVATLPAHSAAVLCLDTDWHHIAQESTATPTHRAAAENLAYVIFTSGSTGKPKGVMIPHRGICNRLLWMDTVYQLDQTDAVLQKATCTFDVSVWEIFWPLLKGSRLVLARQGGEKDHQYLIDLIEQQQITVLHFVPAVLQLFLEEPGLHRCQSIKLMISAGEALPYKLQQRFFTHFKAELFNLYGPTEASIDAMFWRCIDHDDRKLVPVGKPIANMQVYILDQHLNPLPVGIPGDVYFSGAGLARGYIGAPDITAERFIPHPFAADPDQRLYKTGDIGRYLPDGNVDHLGRSDDQMKIRGYRIEPGEIEAALLTYDGIREACVYMQEDIEGHKLLVAYLVAAEQAVIASADLRVFLQSELPGYMIPSAFMFLAALPLLHNGKLDRAALPFPDATAFAQHNYVAARTKIEQLLVTAWEKVLGLSQIGIHDNFFMIGGDSLLSIRLAHEINKAGLIVKPADIIRHQSIAELAAHVREQP